MDHAEQEIRDAQQRWGEAVRSKDEPALDEILADEYVLISARLGFVDREGWLAMARDYDIEEFEYVDSDVHVYGGAAVSNSRYRQKATFRGEDLSTVFYLTDVWVRRDRRWQVVTRHSSIAQSP